jgi:hypothetical protein
MIKNLSLLLSLIVFNSYACNYSDLMSHTNGLKDLLKLAPGKCTDEEFLFNEYYGAEKEEICECAEKSKVVGQEPPPTMNKKRKVPFVKKALEKSEMALYNISKEILNLAVMEGRSGKLNSKFKPSPQCDLSARFNSDGPNSIYQCKGENQILNLEQRKRFGKDLAKRFKNELINTYKKEPSSNGLFDKTLSANKNSCGLPEKDLMEINQSLVPAQLIYLTEIVRENGPILNEAKNLQEALDLISKYDSTDTLDKKIIDEINSIKYNPMLQSFLNSSGTFQEVLVSSDDGKQIYDNAINSGSLKSDLSNELNKKCEQAIQNIQDTLCLNDSDNIISSKPEITLENFKDMEKNTTGEPLVKQNLTNKLLLNEYCPEDSTPSKYDELEIANNKILPPDLQDETDLQEVYESDFQIDVKGKADNICENIPPQKSLDELRSEIAIECDESKGLSSQKCILLTAIMEHTEPKLKSKLAQIETLSLKQAKDEAVAEGKDPSDPSVAEKAIKIAKAMKDNMDADAIFGALKDKKEVDDFANDAGAQMLADFIGGETQKAATAAQTSTNEAGNGTVDSDYAQLEGSNSNSSRSSLNAASFNDGATARNQNSIPEKFRDMSPEDRKTQESMNKVYDEISRRITKTRPARQAARTAAGVGPSEVYIPKDIAQAMESPYPETYESNDLYASTEGGTYDPVVNNYYDTPSIATKPLEAQSPTETASDLRKEQERGYNKALAGMQASRQVMARRDPAGTIPTPKVKVSGVEANQLASKVPEMSLPSGRIDEALNELVDNAIAETGISDSNEANTDQAENLLKLLDPDKNGSFILKDDENENLKVRIAKVNGKFVIKEFYGNEADPAYKKFRRKIERSLLLKDNFKGLIKKLNSALSISTNISEDSLSNSKEDNRRFN